MATENQRKAVRKYDQANTTQVILKLNKKTDLEIINHLDYQDSKMGYLKQLVRDDIARQEKENGRFLTFQELNEWNEEHEREDTLYYIDRREYQKGALKHGRKQEINGDPVFNTSNFYKTIERDYQHLITQARICNEKVHIQIMRAKQIYNNDLEYESVLEWTNIE